MHTDSVLIEAAYMLGKHSGSCSLTPDGARMFSRVFDLTIRAGIANSPNQWSSRKAGRAYALKVVARMGQAAAKLAGRGRDITAEIMQSAANSVIDSERQRFGLPLPDPRQQVLSKFCFCFVLSDIFE